MYSVKQPEYPRPAHPLADYQAAVAPSAMSSHTGPPTPMSFASFNPQRTLPATAPASPHHVASSPPASRHSTMLQHDGKRLWDQIPI